MNVTWATQMSGTRNTRNSAVLWRTFLRGLAIELDAQAGSERTAELLRGTGQQMARLLGLPAVVSLEALEIEMNAVLTEIGWGVVRLNMNEAERCVVVSHSDLPQIGSAGEVPGNWLISALEGLYQGWMDQQPGADPSFQAQVRHQDDKTVVIRYGR